MGCSSKGKMHGKDGGKGKMYGKDADDKKPAKPVKKGGK